MIKAEQREEILRRLKQGETDSANIASETGVSKMQVAAVKAWRKMRADQAENLGTSSTSELSACPKAIGPRAISIRQPYVEMILRGTKVEEYRSHRTLVRGEVYLYAGLKAGDDSEWQRMGMHPGDLPTGKIVGTVEIKDCRRDDAHDCYAYVLENPKRLEQHRTPTNQPQPCFWRPQF